VDDLSRFGPVRMLVAPNAFHTLGLAQWKARISQARVFAPAQSVARVQRQSGLPDIGPVSAASTLCGPRLELIEMPYYRTGEILVRIDTARGHAWYVTDVILNMTELPAQPVARFLFKASNSAPGLRYNNIAPLFMVKDKAAVRRWLAAEAAKHPPDWLIPAHGAVVDLRADRDAARSLFAQG
jgi:hypothetical protein